MPTENTTRDMLFDRRVVDRNIKKGLVSREDYDRFVAGLSDTSANAETIQARLGIDDDIDDSDGPEEGDAVAG